MLGNNTKTKVLKTLWSNDPFGLKKGAHGWVNKQMVKAYATPSKIG